MTDSDTPDWRPIGSFAARYEIEIPLQQLEAAGIPVIVKGEEAGIWGPAFAGPTSQGITLMVPAEFVDEARALLVLDEAGEAGEAGEADEAEEPE